MHHRNVQGWERGKAVGVILVVLLAGGLSPLGCSVYQRVRGPSGATPALTATPAPAADTAVQVFYAGAAGLNVYSEPASSSKLVGRLALYEKVTRYKIERGYAYVKSSQSELTGWVNNAALLWRLPPVKTEPEAAPGTVAPEPPAGPAEEEPGIPEAPEPTAMEVPPTPAPTLTSTPAAGATPTPRGAGRSLFDPY